MTDADDSIVPELVRRAEEAEQLRKEKLSQNLDNEKTKQAGPEAPVLPNPEDSAPMTPDHPDAEVHGTELIIHHDE